MIKKSIAIICLLSIFAPLSLLALTVEKNSGVPVENRFIVGPAKVESIVSPGEVKEIRLTVENRTGQSQSFQISFEDFEPSDNPEETITLLGEKTSNTTLKNFLYVNQNEFVLEHGDRAIVPVTISLPANVTVGGRFGSVIVRALQNRTGVDVNDRAYTGATLIGQIATLLFVTIPGDTVSKGQLVSFTTKNNQRIFSGDEIPVRLMYENTGNVHLNPYGGITVKNMFGKIVAKIPLEPWFALPQSLRTRDSLIISKGMFGKYTATAEVNRGYGDIVDEKTISFFVIPYSVVVLIAILVAGAAWVVRMVIKRKRFPEI